jgi:hypothetical protein
MKIHVVNLLSNLLTEKSLSHLKKGCTAFRPLQGNELHQHLVLLTFTVWKTRANFKVLTHYLTTA